MLNIGIYSVSPPPPPQCFLWPPVTNYMLLYSTLLCKKIARAPGGHKKFRLTKRGGGGGRNRIDPNNEYIMNIRLVLINSINSNDDLVIHLLSRFFHAFIYNAVLCYSRSWYFVLKYANIPVLITLFVVTLVKYEFEWFWCCFILTAVKFHGLLNFWNAMEESEEQHSFLNKKTSMIKLIVRLYHFLLTQKWLVNSNRLASKENFSSFSNNSI